MKQKYCDQQLDLCSTVVGTFFKISVRIVNKIKASIAFDAKICRHTT